MPPRVTSQAMIDAARNRPKPSPDRKRREYGPRPDLRHPDYDKRLALIAERRAARVPFRLIARELGVSVQRVKQLAALLPSCSSGSAERTS